jgi:hypothetical protein
MLKRFLLLVLLLDRAATVLAGPLRTPLLFKLNRSIKSSKEVRQPKAPRSCKHALQLLFSQATRLSLHISQQWLLEDRVCCHNMTAAWMPTHVFAAQPSTPTAHSPCCRCIWTPGCLLSGGDAVPAWPAGG